MQAQSSIKTTCPYCGVGCGLVVSKNATTDSAKQNAKLVLQGDADHPANYGRLCSKGINLLDTIKQDGRLLHPHLDGDRVSWDSALSKVAKKIQNTINKYGPDSFAIYASAQLLTEDYYVANKLMKGFIGAANIDTNSRLCMASAVAAHKRAFGSDTVPCGYTDLEQANLIVLVGSNTAWCHPVLFQRIRKAKENNPQLKIIVIDPRETATQEIADNHLAIKPGTDAMLFNGLLSYLTDCEAIDNDYINSHTEGFEKTIHTAQQSTKDLVHIAEYCGIEISLLKIFYKSFASTKNAITLFSQGINQSSSGVDKANAIINCHLATGKIGHAGMGPFSITGQPNAMGGREVGGLTNTLAAHMDFDNKSIDRVSRYWNSDTVAKKPGYKAVDLFDAVLEGKVKVLWILATNPLVSLPNTNKIRKALKKCEYVIVSECIQSTDTTQYANALLPASAWSEKDGTVTNSERRISRQRPFLTSPGEAKPDWWIITQVAKQLGFRKNFDYSHPFEIFREHAGLSGFENNGERDFDIGAYANIDKQQYDSIAPFLWPKPNQHHNESERLFSNGKFFTASRKAQFIAIEAKAPKHTCSEQYPWTLNTGRVRDQWHTMTRTGLSEKLNKHSPEPFLRIHPEDADKAGVRHLGLANIVSQWGELITRVHIDTKQNKGSVFIPIHWSNQFSSTGSVGQLISTTVDPISGQPEFKQTPVMISQHLTEHIATVLSRYPLNIQASDYWSSVKGDFYYKYQLAFNGSGNFLEILKTEITKGETDYIEYKDNKRGAYRFALFENDRLSACVFDSLADELPDMEWVSSLFSKQCLDEKDRKSILAAKPFNGELAGSIVCACYAVGKNTINNAIKNDACTTVQALGDKLKAGTNCGSCIPELNEIITSTLAAS